MPGGPWDCNTRLDDSESQSSTGAEPGFPLNGPLGLPQDTNMDNHVYATGLGGIGATLPDALGNRLDPAGVDDCARPADPLASPDTKEPGPRSGTVLSGNPAAPPWDAPNFDGEGSGVHVPRHRRRHSPAEQGRAHRPQGSRCEDPNVTGGNYGAQVNLPLFGGASTVSFNRAWVSADVSVRGKKFRLVSTHLEDEETGTAREDQASELVAAGGPASVPKTVLIGDLNSDPSTDRDPIR